MLLSTGNKSELAVGYCTLYGDMCGGLAVISDVPKTLVYDLARYVNREREVIPRSSITKAPSAELRPNQTDQDTLPPYDVIDRDHRGLRRARPRQRGASSPAASTAPSPRSIIGRIDRNEYKRRQAAPGLKITSEGVRRRPALSHRGATTAARRPEARRAGPRGRPARTVMPAPPRRRARSISPRSPRGCRRRPSRASRRRRPDISISDISSTRSTSGASRGRSAAACNCGSRITTAVAVTSRIRDGILDDLEWLGVRPRLAVDRGAPRARPARAARWIGRTLHGSRW